jgi:hypothetical protein
LQHTSHVETDGLVTIRETVMTPVVTIAAIRRHDRQGRARELISEQALAIAQIDIEACDKIAAWARGVSVAVLENIEPLDRGIILKPGGTNSCEVRLVLAALAVVTFPLIPED